MSETCRDLSQNKFDILIYLLTTVGLSPGGSSTVHIYTQTVHRTTQNKQYTEQHNNLEECGPCPVLASYTLAFVLQLRKKHGKTSVRVAASKNTQTTIRIHRLTVRVHSLFQSKYINYNHKYSYKCLRRPYPSRRLATATTSQAPTLKTQLVQSATALQGRENFFLPKTT